MISLDLQLIKSFKIEISCKDSTVLTDLMTYLRTHRTYMQVINLPNGKRKFVERTSEVKLYRKVKQKLTVNLGLIDYISLYIASICKKYDLEVNFTSQSASPIILSDKWIQRFRSHPHGIDRGEMQIQDFHKLSRNATGIAELFTGYGKTELILSLAECSGERTVILVPDNGIRDEVLSRSKKYDIDVGNYDYTKNINVINVMGFMRSKNLNDEAKEWLKDVKICLTDECHHASAESYQNFFDFLINLERSHGFSASTDVATGKKIIANQVDIRDLGPNPALVIGCCGPVRITRTSKIPVSLFQIITNVADRSVVNEQDNWSAKLDQSLINEKMSSVISQIFQLDSDKVFFIPIHKKESGEVLYSNLIDAGYYGILWTSDIFKVNGQQENCSDILSRVKSLMLQQRFHFVMSTKLEGLDIPKLNAVIPLVGTNYRMVVQPVGRAARTASMDIFLIYDKNNPITISQSATRLETIEKEYNIISSKKVIIHPKL